MGRILKLTAAVALLNLIWIGFSYANSEPLIKLDNCPSVPFEKGRIFEISQQGKPSSYIFGTMHSKHPDVLKLPTAAAIAITEVPKIATEISMNEQAQLEAFKMTILPDGQDLFEIIGPKRTDKLKQVLREYGLPEQLIRRLKPWAVSTLLGQSPEELRDTTTPVLDGMIQNIAEKTGRIHLALEDINEQLSFFNNMSPEFELEFLDSTLNSAGLSDYYRDLLRENYLKGNTGIIFCMAIAVAASESEKMKSFILDDLLTKRNYRMVDRMLPHTKGGVFVAVGAAHLPGEEGILNLLKKQGYQVRRLSGAAPAQ